MFGAAIGGVAIAAVLASMLSMDAANAQMVSTPNQQMMHNQQMQKGLHYAKQPMFSASGMSMVQDVRVAGVSITGDNEVTANIIYNGNGTSPDVTVIAMTNHKAMMGMMYANSMDGMGSSMMSTGSTGMYDMMPSSNMANSTQYQMMQTQSGSDLVEGGWESGEDVQITLDGDESVYEASDVHVMVFPHIT